MKRLFLVILIISIFFGIYFIVNNYFPYLVSNTIPVSKNIVQYLPASNKTTSPFNLLNGYKIDVFADLKNDLPRAMTFDDNQNMIVSLPSKGKVTVLSDLNNDLKIDKRKDILFKLNKPHGLEYKDGYLYVAETNMVSRYMYNFNTQEIGQKEILFELPADGRHFTRTIKINGNKLYTSIGSSCNVCIEKNIFRASILVSELDGSNLEVFAKGLRNTVFFDFDKFGKMWGADIGRDNLGDNLPPDEINIIERGNDYGWPYCYSNNIKDLKYDSDEKNQCNNKVGSIYDLPAHSSPLGLTFDSANNIYVALHGSKNSSFSVGYKIIKLTTFADRISDVEDFVTGFLSDSGNVLGRPSGLIFDKDGNLYISDDKSGLIYVVSD